MNIFIGCSGPYVDSRQVGSSKTTRFRKFESCTHLSKLFIVSYILKVKYYKISSDIIYLCK